MISVIVPVFKVEKYLDECILSILGQTYKDLEVILVDDDSPDICGKMCDHYAELDSRVRVIHNCHSGLSGTRNRGLEEATGDYIIFADSDDYLAPDMLEKMLNNLEETGADIAICGFSRTNELGRARPNINPMIQKKRIFSNRKGMRDLLSIGGYTSFAWNKLCKRELLEGVRYPQGRYYEDMATTYKIFHRASNIVYDPAIGYYYRQRRNSIIHQMNWKKCLHYRESAIEFCSFIKKHYKEYAFWADYLVVRTQITIVYYKVLSFFSIKRKPVENKGKSLR